MDQSVNQETDPTMSDSLCEFNKQHTVDEMRAMIRDLDKVRERLQIKLIAAFRKWS